MPLVVPADYRAGSQRLSRGSTSGGCARPLAIIVLVVVVVLGTMWFLDNTTLGLRIKCQYLHDLGACLIVGLTDSTTPPNSGQPVVPDVTPQRPTYQCYAAVAGHNAVVGIDVASADQCALVQALLAPYGFDQTTGNIAGADRLICSVQEVSGHNSSDWTADVWDSGSAMYGTNACQALDAASTPVP